MGKREKKGSAAHERGFPFFRKGDAERENPLRNREEGNQKGKGKEKRFDEKKSGPFFRQTALPRFDSVRTRTRNRAAAPSAALWTEALPSRRRSSRTRAAE